MANDRRPDDMVRIITPELAQAFIDEQVKLVQEQVGDKKVLLALSGVMLGVLVSRIKEIRSGEEDDLSKY